MRARSELANLVVEFIGVFTLVFAGAGAIIATKGENLVAIALAHGLAIGLMVAAAGHVSGGVFNPAIALALLVPWSLFRIPHSALRIHCCGRSTASLAGAWSSSR